MVFLKQSAFLLFLIVASTAHVTATEGRRLNDAPVSVSATVVGGSYQSNKDSDIQLPFDSGLLSSILDVEVQQILQEQQAVADRQAMHDENIETEGDVVEREAYSVQQDTESSQGQKIAPAPSESFDEEMIGELDSGFEG